MKIEENVGATCQTCAHQKTRPRNKCRQCVARSGKPGWDPAPGVQVQLCEVYETLTKRRYLARKVIS